MASIELVFEWSVLTPGAAPAPVSIEGRSDGVHLRGTISAGRRGWQLSCTASLKRRRLLLQVVARPTGSLGSRDVEDYEYRAHVRGLTPGRVHVSVLHTVVAPGLPTSPGEPSYAGTVLVAPD